MAKGDKNTGKPDDSAGDLLKKVDGDAVDAAKDAEHAVTGAVSTLEGDAKHVETEARKGFGLLDQLGKQIKNAASVKEHAALHTVHGALAGLRSKLEAAEEHADGEVKEFLASLRKHL